LNHDGPTLSLAGSHPFGSVAVSFSRFFSVSRQAAGWVDALENFSYAGFADAAREMESGGQLGSVPEELGKADFL
jgi:hypothetical protein